MTSRQQTGTAILGGCTHCVCSGCVLQARHRSIDDDDDDVFVCACVRVCVCVVVRGCRRQSPLPLQGTAVGRLGLSEEEAKEQMENGQYHVTECVGVCVSE